MCARLSTSAFQQLLKSPSSSVIINSIKTFFPDLEHLRPSRGVAHFDSPRTDREEQEWIRAGRWHPNWRVYRKLIYLFSTRPRGADADAVHENCRAARRSDPSVSTPKDVLDTIRRWYPEKNYTDDEFEAISRTGSVAVTKT